MNIAIRKKIRTKSGIEEVSCIISFEYMYTHLELGSNHVMKVFANPTSFRIFFYKKYQLRRV